VAEVTSLGVDLDTGPHDDANLTGAGVGGGILYLNPFRLITNRYGIIPYLLVSLGVYAFFLPVEGKRNQGLRYA
jgi:hypothetical protein